jgi:signal transduction histidine kinase
MADLDAAVEALALRMRVADELATRSQASAEHTSAGMFELLSGAIAAEEAARGQLAAELHDTVAQSLAVARTLLADGQQERATACVEDAEEQVRAIMARTRPPALREGDLAEAVTDFCADLEQRYALLVDIRWPSEPRPLPLSTAITLYRFFQESLLNVVKHADVDTAELTLAFDGGHVVATIRDEGPGFDPGSVRPQRGRHVGLGLLRERIRLAGGTLDVRSAPGRGTRLVMSMPLPAGPPGRGAQERWPQDRATLAAATVLSPPPPYVSAPSDEVVSGNGTR